MQEWLLATDLDGTLIGDDAALATLNKQLQVLRSAHQLKLAYITGRSLQLYKELEAEKSLLVPDALVTAVGTEIYWDGVDLAEDWPSNTQNWKRDVIFQLLQTIPDLELQPPSEQRPYKISYILTDPAVLEHVHQAVEGFDLDIIFSHDQYLDILPKGIQKGSALLHLAQAWGINDGRIIACGDSANDIAMLEVGSSVLVGNAKPELVSWAHQNSANSAIYFAKNNFAAGIAEGINYFQNKL